MGGMVAALTFLFPVPSAECSLNESMSEYNIVAEIKTVHQSQPGGRKCFRESVACGEVEPAIVPECRVVQGVMKVG